MNCPSLVKLLNCDSLFRIDMIEGKKADKRRRIIQSATSIFANYGFYNAKISQIAHMADVADGTIYLYFKSKDDILICIFEEEMARVISMQEESLSKGTTATEKLKLFAKSHAKMVMNNVDLATFFQLEIRQSSKFMKHYENVQFANYLQLIAEIIELGKKTAEFLPDTNSNLVKHSYFGAIDEISTQWVLLESKRFDLSSTLEETTALFIRGIRL